MAAPVRQQADRPFTPLLPGQKQGLMQLQVAADSARQLRNCPAAAAAAWQEPPACQASHLHMHPSHLQASCAASGNCSAAATPNTSRPPGPGRYCRTKLSSGAGGGVIDSAGGCDLPMTAVLLVPTAPTAGDWLDALLLPVDMVADGAGVVCGEEATAASPLYGDQDTDDLRPDVAGVSSIGSCSSVAAIAAAAATSLGKAAACNSVAAVAAACLHKSPLSAGATRVKDSRPKSTLGMASSSGGAARAAILRSSAHHRRPCASATLLTHGSSTAAAAACRASGGGLTAASAWRRAAGTSTGTGTGSAGAPAAAGSANSVVCDNPNKEEEDDVASDAGSKPFSTRWFPATTRTHNAQLLHLLGLPNAGSLCLPVPEPHLDRDLDPECVDYVSDLDLCADERVSILSVLGDESVLAEEGQGQHPRVGAAVDFEFELLPASSSPWAPPRTAVTSPACGRPVGGVGGGGDGDGGNASRADSCSLEADSNPGLSASSGTASAPAPRALARPTGLAQQQQLLLQQALLHRRQRQQQQQHHRPSCPPAEVEVLNIFGSTAAAPQVRDVGHVTPYIGNIALSYINSLQLYSDDADLPDGGCGQDPGRHQGLPSTDTDMLAALFAEDDIAAGEEEYGTWCGWAPSAAAAAATAAGGDGADKQEPSGYDHGQGPLMTSLNLGPAWL